MDLIATLSIKCHYANGRISIFVLGRMSFIECHGTVGEGLRLSQGTLTEGEGSVQLTSLYQLV